MKSSQFWEFYESVRPKLGARADSLAKIFEHLDQFDRPVGIIETGCTRDAGNWTGDGNSTVLFDRYAQTHPGTAVYTVDIDPQATALCRGLVSPLVTVCTGDSVAFLRQLADEPPANLPHIDVLYLDSYDLNFDDPLPSALHHLKELLAIAPRIAPDTLVVVDDSPAAFSGFFGANGVIHLVTQPKPGGKGKLVGEYATNIGAEKVFEGYQCAWKRMRGSVHSTVPASGFAHAVVTRSEYGSFAVGIEDRYVGASLLATGKSGHAEVERAAAYLQPEDNVLVVGAHVGTVGIPLARHCRHLTAIEANPDTFRLLQCNVLLNNTANVTALNFAASNREETLRFVLNRHNSGGSKRMPQVHDDAYFYDNPDIVEVPAYALDAKLEGQSFALVFMDIEGSEYFAFQGMQRILASARTLIVEFIPHHLAKVAGVTPEAFVQAIEAHFSNLYVPSTGERIPRAQFASTLRRMFDSNQGDDGIVFTK